VAPYVHSRRAIERESGDLRQLALFTGHRGAGNIRLHE
jgi:hypothetical protein